jgi:CCR4-NOT transcription complex subunit 1
MDPSRLNDVSSSLVSGIAERISLSDGSDPSNGIANILADVGPSCTRSTSTFRDLLAEVARTSGRINEASLASLIYFFSDKTGGGGEADAASAGLSSTLLGSIIAGRGHEGQAGGWNLKAVAQVLSEDYSSRDWLSVPRHWDVPGFIMQDANQFRTLLDLYRAGANNTPSLSAFTVQWRNSAGQLSVFESIIAVPPSVFMVPLNEEELADAATAPPPGQSSAPNPQCWASMAILQRLLYLSDVPSLYRRVRDLFVKCLLSCPEVLLCSLVRLQLRVANAAAQAEAGNDPLVNAGMQIKTELMRELIPLFFRPNAHHRVQNGPAALRRLYAISPSTVTAACFEAWRSTASDAPQSRLATIVHIINIARLLPSPTEAVASLLNGSKDAEFSIAVAFVMSDNDYLQLKPWLGEKLASKNSLGTFAVALVTYLRKTYTSAAPRGGRGDGKGAPLVSLENIVTSLQLLLSLDASILSQGITGMAAEGQLAGGSTLGDNVNSLVEACVSAYPSLRASFSPPAPGPSPAGQVATGGGGVAASDDVEEQATAYFQKIYTSEQSIGEVVEMLKRFKTSGNAKENEIFACMVHNLFDEYRFFSKYPEKELRITGILFGALIQEQLVSSITLGIALRYVLEALRKPPSPPGATTSSGKMFKFGMFALEQFKGRLHEWPQYCSHIVQIPHLKEGYADLVAEIEHEMTKTQGRAPGNTGAVGAQPGTLPPAPSSKEAFGVTPDSLSRSSSSDGLSQASQLLGAAGTLNMASAPVLPEAKPRVAEFGPKLGRAVTEGVDEDREFDAPPDAILDRVQFLVNNLAPSNVEKKAQELRDMLDPQYFGWLGHFLVVKRISTQANFHSLYLSFLDNLGDYGKGLVEAILASVYHSIGKLLRSPKITTSSSERSYLKNLGIWLGQITLSRNRPILQIMLDCKELLLQGYETGKLIAVAPFLAKTLEGAKNSIIFRPPNPWLMGILGVFRCVYNVEGLKMNIKFEVEVLCKNLGIKLEDIQLRNEVLACRVAPVKERNPDFNIKSSASQKSASAVLPSARALVGSPDAQSMALPATPGGPSGEEAGRNASPGQEQQDTVIPNLAAYVTVNPSLPQLLQGTGLGALTTASLKRWVPIAVDRAIREIIQPVVERSVTIACITTKEIVTKDFAMESDETKMRKAGQLMVANLAGSLALVTCREPLRASVSTHLRQLLTSNLGRTDKLGEQEQNVIEQCVQICATDNIELGCMLIEKAATEKAVRDVDEALSAAMNARRKHREQTGQPFYDMSIFSNGNQRYPNALPDQLRPKPGGLRPEHFQLYDSFQRMPRQSQGLGPTTGGSGVGLPLTRTASGSASDADAAPPVKPVGGQQFSTDLLTALAAKLDSAVTSLLGAAGARAAEIKLSMLPRESQIRQLLSAVKQIMPNASQKGGASRPLVASEQELVLGFSQGIFKRLYELNLSEPLRLEALVALLENINTYCPKLGKDMGTWATYAPTNTEPQRRLHRTVLLLLVRSRLLSVQDLDAFLAARADSGRNHIWVEFSLLFIRTAFMEQISSPPDFPKLIDLMAKIAEGRSQATVQVAQTYRKPILRMLDETRALGVSNEQQPSLSSESHEVLGAELREQSVEESSSLSMTSLSNLTEVSMKVAEATDVFRRNDPPTARQQVAALLEGWLRLQSESAGNDKVLAQYLQVLHQFGVGKVEQQTERFLRLSTVIMIEAVLKSAAPSGDGSRMSLNYQVVDHYSKLLVLLFQHMNSGGSVDQVDAQRLGMLNKILGVIVRTMMWHAEKTKSGGGSLPGGWDQRPWFRLIMNLIIDLNKPNQTFEPIRLGILSVFGAAFHTCQPLVMSGFSFAWLELVSHRHFLPNLLLFPGQKGWSIAHQLLVDHFLFLEPYLRRVELVAPIKKLYEGTLRVLLVLLHDFPSFLAAYHLSFCNVIPENCVQLRNIVLSATPKGMSPPDPFTPNLKIDLLSEISQSPLILSNALGPIESIRSHLDAFLKDGQRRNFSGLLPLLYKEGTSEVDPPKVNSLVLFVGAHALARLQNAQISLSRTPEMEIIQKLMELDDRGRYTCLNAIANQLRFPSSHTHYFSCVMLYLFSESKSVAVKEQVTRVLLERLIVNRPHPWGLLITFIELIKNQRYGFWSFPFTRCATEIEKVFESVARSCMPPGAQRTALVGGEEQ